MIEFVIYLNRHTIVNTLMKAIRVEESTRVRILEPSFSFFHVPPAFFYALSKERDSSLCHVSCHLLYRNPCELCCHAQGKPSLTYFSNAIFMRKLFTFSPTFTCTLSMILHCCNNYISLSDYVFHSITSTFLRRRFTRI